MQTNYENVTMQDDDDSVSDVKKILHFNKGDIYICQLDEDENAVDNQFFSKSGLIGKTRPCMIFSTLEYNDAWRNTYTVIPIKTNNTELPTKEYIQQSPDIFVPIMMHGTEKLLMVNQARPLSARRIRSYLGTIVNQDILNEVDRLFLQCHFGLSSDISKIYSRYGSTDRIIKFLCSEKGYTCFKHYMKETTGEVIK